DAKRCCTRGNLERGSQHVEDPICNDCQAGSHRFPIDENDELISSESADGVALSKGIEQPLCDRHEQLISGLVTKRVVDIFEVVEIEEHHGPALVMAPRSREHLRQTVLDQSSIRESRQRVVK